MFPRTGFRRVRPTVRDGATRAVVLGLGPAGRAAAHRAAARGWEVLAIDPAGGAGSMPSTIGVWTRQLPGWLPDAAVAARFRPLVIDADGRERRLDEYAVLDTGVLGGLGGFRTLRGRGVSSSSVRLAWSGNAPGGGDCDRGFRARVRDRLRARRARRLSSATVGPGVVVLDESGAGDCGGAYWDGSAGPAEPGILPDGWDSPDVLVDASPTSYPLPVLQLAVGHVVPGTAIPERHRRPVLMDFTEPPSAAAAAEEPEAPATFSYRLPLGDGRWLIEETILAAHVVDDAHCARLTAHLRRAQAARLAALGVDPTSAVDEELVRFHLGPARVPSHRPRTALGERLRSIPVGRGVYLDLSGLVPWSGRGTPGVADFGASGGWMHPATGYSVGASLADVDRVLDRLIARADATPRGGRLLLLLRRRGLAALLAFDAPATREFFTCFLRLPAPFIRAYLTGGSALATLGVMASVAVPLLRRSPRTLGLLLSGSVRRLPRSGIVRLPDAPSPGEPGPSTPAGA